MTQVQAAYLGSGNAGSGVLFYQGGRYPFSVGGIGISKIEAKGEVYGLQHLRDFAGAYVQGRYGFRRGHYERGRPVAEERKWRYHASGRKAARADAESGRCGRNPNEPVASCVVVGHCSAESDGENCSAICPIGIDRDAARGGRFIAKNRLWTTNFSAVALRIHVIQTCISNIGGRE